VSQYQKKHSPTHTQPIMVINHPLSASSIYYDPRHPPCSIYVPDSLSAHKQMEKLTVYPMDQIDILFSFVRRVFKIYFITYYSYSYYYVTLTSGRASGSSWPVAVSPRGCEAGGEQ